MTKTFALLLFLSLPFLAWAQSIGPAPPGAGTSADITVGTTTITGGTTTRVLYDNAGALGEYALSGSGSSVAMALSPTFTTPTLGAAQTTTMLFGAGSDAYISRNASGILNIGTTTSNAAGALTLTNLQFAGTLTGTTMFLPALPLDTGLSTSSVCTSSSGRILKGSGVAGICLGTSSMRFKERIRPEEDGLAQIVKLEPKNFFYRKGWGDNGWKEQYGFMAEDVASVLPGVVGRDAQGQPNTVDLVAMIPILVKAIQEQQKQIEALKAR